MSLSSLYAEYFISIGNNSDTKNSIVSTGGGNNYYNKSMNALLSDNAYDTDIVLHSFNRILRDYQQKKINDRIDAFQLIKENTNLDNIKLKVAIFDGSAAIIFMNVEASGNNLSTFTPMKIVDGKWTINGSIMQNSNIMSIFTLMLNYGQQISPSQFSSYRQYLSNLSPDTALPVIAKITKDGVKRPSFVILTYMMKGKLYDKISLIFGKFLLAYEKKDGTFLTYWGKEEARNIEMLNSNVGNRILTLESPELTKLDKCKNGYTIAGVTDLGSTIVIYVITEDGELYSFFMRRYANDEYKFVASSIYGGCSIYASSFFSSPEFRESFMLSATLFKTKMDLEKQISTILGIKDK